MDTDLVLALYRGGALSLAEIVEWADAKLANFDVGNSESDFELFESLISISCMEKDDIQPFDLEGSDLSLGLIDDFAIRVTHLNLNDKDRVEEFNQWVLGRATQFYELDKEVGSYGYSLSEDWPPAEEYVQNTTKYFKKKYETLSTQICAKIT